MSISRVRYVGGGDARKAAYKPNPLYPFQKGDLLFLHPTDHMLRPATAIPPEATEALNQLDFAQYFVGVADEKYGLQPATGAYDGEKTFNVALAGAQRSISVCTAGNFEFDCPSQNFLPNQPVGIYAQPGGIGITDAQTVDALAAPAAVAQMIGTVIQQEAPIEQSAMNTPQTRVVVSIQGGRAFQNPSTWQTAAATGTFTGTSGQ